MPLSAKY